VFYATSTTDGLRNSFKHIMATEPTASRLFGGKPLCMDLLGDTVRRVPECDAGRVLKVFPRASDVHPPEWQRSRDKAVKCCRTACRNEPRCTFRKLNAGSGITSGCSLGANFSRLTRSRADGNGKPFGMFKEEPLGPLSEIFPTKARVIEEERAQLREELNRPCALPEWLPGGTTGRSRARALAVEPWLRWALAQPEPQTRGFPELNVFLSTRTCRDARLETDAFAWFVPSLQEGDAGVTIRPWANWSADGLLTARANTHKKIALPRCPYGPGGVYKRVRVPDKRRALPPLPHFRDAIALLDADTWMNPSHALQHVMWLDSTVRKAALRGDGIPPMEIVPTWSSLTGDFNRSGLLHHQPYTPLVATAMDAFGLPQLNSIPLPRGNDNIQCYKVAAQRMFHFPADRRDYTFRERMLRHCGISPSVRMRRKVLFWYKISTGHNQFHDLPRVASSLANWSASAGLDFTMTELNAEDLSHSTSCDQVRLWSDPAIYVGIHGGAGINVAWMPPDSVYIEMAWSDGSPEIGTRVTRSGYYSQLASLTGVLYTHFHRGLPLEFTPINNEIPRYIAFDVQADLLPLLDVIYTEWLQARLRF